MYSVKAMDQFNNNITVISENNDPLSLLQLSYRQIEQSPHSQQLNSVGVLTLMNAPAELKCHVANGHKDGRSLLKISDPRSHQKNINLKLFHNDILTIHAKNENNIVIIRKNGDVIDYFTYNT